jgi:hypothetical protein
VLADDDRACGEVAEALAAGRGDDADGADAVEEGEEVHDADQVAQERLGEGDGGALIADHADAGLTLAGGLAVPEHFEDNVVAEEDEGSAGDDDGGQGIGALAEGGPDR